MARPSWLWAAHSGRSRPRTSETQQLNSGVGLGKHDVARERTSCAWRCDFGWLEGDLRGGSSWLLAQEGSWKSGQQVLREGEGEQGERRTKGEE